MISSESRLKGFENKRRSFGLGQSVDKPLFRRELSKRFPMPLSPMSLGIKRIDESSDEISYPSQQQVKYEDQRSIRKKIRSEVVQSVEEVQERVRRTSVSSEGRLKRDSIGVRGFGLVK